MLTQYIYKPSDVGLADWPSGTLRLEGIDVTDDPRAADCFVCPGNIRIFEGDSGSGILDMDKLHRLPYFKGNESRHAFFDCSDNFKQPVRLPIMFIRCDVRKWMLSYDPNTIQMAWPVADLAECVHLPAGGFKYDVSFQGWNSCLVRKVSATSCQENRKIKADIAIYPDFYGYIENKPEGVRRRAEFLRSLRESRMVLCPESIPGVLPYRFFEAMSAGRYPVLVGRDYVLPFANHIPYDEFISRIDTDQAYEAGEIVAEIRSRHTDAVFQEKGELARRCWEQYLDSRIWPKIMAQAVAEHLKAVLA